MRLYCRLNAINTIYSCYRIFLLGILPLHTQSSVCCGVLHFQEKKANELPVQIMLLFLTFSALVTNPKKTTLNGGQSRSWSAEQGIKRINVRA